MVVNGNSLEKTQVRSCMEAGNSLYMTMVAASQLNQWGTMWQWQLSMPSRDRFHCQSVLGRNFKIHKDRSLKHIKAIEGNKSHSFLYEHPIMEHFNTKINLNLILVDCAMFRKIRRSLTMRGVVEKKSQAAQTLRYNFTTDFVSKFLLSREKELQVNIFYQSMELHRLN